MTNIDATRWLLGGLVVLAVALFVGPLLLGAGSGMGGPIAGGMWGPIAGETWGPMNDGSMGGVDPAWWWLLASVWRLLLLVVLVGAVYLLYRRATGDEATDPALEELRSAYARGDLSDEEFERRRERMNE